MSSLCWFTTSNLSSRWAYALKPIHYFWNDIKSLPFEHLKCYGNENKMFILSTTLAPLSRNMDICQTLRSLECRHIKSLLSWPSDNILVKKYRVLLKAKFFKEKQLLVSLYDWTGQQLQTHTNQSTTQYNSKYHVGSWEAKVLVTHTTPKRSWHR